MTAHDAQWGEGDPVGIVIGLQCGSVHQVPDGVVDEQEAVEFLLGSIRVLGTQHQVGTAEVGLDLIEAGLELPTLGVEFGQFAAGASSGSRIVVMSR
ncbi:hypothetical protein ACFVU4_22840 [Streptomyces sp. NPDC058107]|uniref:hypothetical protein n=1 Tax=Streptomyces sp. NPDC058107 TaxID=3346343 RepID=UPI0036E0FCE6